MFVSILGALSLETGFLWKALFLSFSLGEGSEDLGEEIALNALFMAGAVGAAFALLRRKGGAAPAETGARKPILPEEKTKPDGTHSFGALIARGFSPLLGEPGPELAQLVTAAQAELAKGKWDGRAHTLLREWRTLSHFELLAGDIHLVHTFGKVGSMTLHATISALPLAGHLFSTHVHEMSETALRRIRAREMRKKRYGELTPRGYLEDLRIFLQLRNSVASLLAPHGGMSGRTNVVSALREPVAMLISRIFHNLNYEAAPAPVSTEWLLGRVERNLDFPEKLDGWFANEMRGVHGIDVFAQPFAKAEGFQIYEAGSRRLLVIRLENFDQLARSLGRFYDLEPAEICVQNSNRSAERQGADDYERISKEVVVPAAWLDRFYGHPTIAHFYSPEEIARFRAYWTEPSLRARRG